MKISVITVCYNAANTLEQTMLSVLNQTYSDVEYIIIDGGSVDGTVDIIKKYADRLAYWISEPDNGIYDAMNKGIKVSTGKWINFKNAGDIFYSDNIIQDFFTKVDNIAHIIYGDLIYETEIGLYEKKPFPLEQMNSLMPIGHPATFIRSDYHKEHLYDTKYRSSSDYDFLYKAYYQDNCTFQYIPMPVAYYDDRVGMSKDNFEMVMIENLKIVGRYNNVFDICKCHIHIYIIKLNKIIRSFLNKHYFKKKMGDELREIGFVYIEGERPFLTYNHKKI